MKLVSARIQNFRCVEDSDEFSLHPVTCLVGKNESGKTAILEALAGLKPHENPEQQFNRQLDYPRRHLRRYQERHGTTNAQVVTTRWKLDTADIKAVEDIFGAGCLPSDEITVSKSYDESNRNWETGFDSHKAVQHLLNVAGCTAAEKKKYSPIKSTPKLLEELRSVTTPSASVTKLKELIGKYRKNDASLQAIDILSQRLPTFLFFSQYQLMKGKVSAEALASRLAQNKLDESDKVFLAFLDFANTSLDELIKSNQYETLKSKVEAASNSITDQIFEYWSQNKNLRVEFSQEAGRSGDETPFDTGNVLHTRIKNLLHEMTVPFDKRSMGFVWFFSFLVYFAHVKKTHGNIVILLDEPGLNLHAKAQGDLLRYIDEKLRPYHQVVYTTHSPFMVPANSLSSVRTVEDKVIQKGPFQYDIIGTKVGDDVLSTDRDTLFPLQGALGYEITQSLFIGENTLLVEGPSDILYLEAVSNVLKARGGSGLDDRWTLCPAGGVDKLQTFVSLFGGNKLNIAVLSDFARGSKAKVEAFRKSGLLEDSRFLLVTEFCSQDEGDIEDLFGRELYLRIVNGAYQSSEVPQFSLEDLETTIEKSERVVLRVQELARTRYPDGVNFEHFTPSRWLLQNEQLLENSDQATQDALSRFEAVFNELNQLLPSKVEVIQMNSSDSKKSAIPNRRTKQTEGIVENADKLS